MKRGRPSDRESGQVEVETAIVMPMVIFLLLGLIQLGLLHQARIMAKYAAYRAVRAGAVYNFDMDRMEKAAVAAALPVLSYRSGDAELLGRTDGATHWIQKWTTHGFMMNRMLDIMLPYVVVRRCGPLKSEVSAYQYGQNVVAFDHPGMAGKKGKLRIEVQLNYRLMIPFVDWVIYRMWTGANITRELHLGHGPATWVNTGGYSINGVHVVPIRAQYSMHLMSDALVDKFPEQCECLAGGGCQ